LIKRCEVVMVADSFHCMRAWKFSTESSVVLSTW